MTRFGDNSINRDAILEKLFGSPLYYQPDLDELLLELLEHPALDAPAEIIVINRKQVGGTLRSRLNLNGLMERVPERNRPRFKPWLQKLAESGESETASVILQGWK